MHIHEAGGSAALIATRFLSGSNYGGSAIYHTLLNGNQDPLLFGMAGDDAGASSYTIPTDSSQIKMVLRKSGSLGIATTSPWRTLSVTGTVGFDGLTGATGAGSLCLDSNKQVVYNSASDACLSSTRSTKHEISPLVVDAIEQVPSVISGIDDRAILATVVKAIKDLYAKVSEYFARTEQLEERVSALEAQLAASAEAGAPPYDGQEAPASSPAREATPNADSITATTSTATVPAVAGPATDAPTDQSEAEAPVTTQLQ